MDLLGVRLGFGFSAGLFDYVLNYSQGTRPLMLVPIGAAYFALYYGLFRFCIARFDLKTPGRDAEEAAPDAAAGAGDSAAAGWVRALGGAANLESIDACTTRLRLVVADQSAIDEAALKRLGARGVVRPSAQTLQVVVGPIADQLASQIRAESRVPAASVAPAAQTASAAQPHVAATSTTLVSAATLLTALGGTRNVRDVRLASSRLCVTLEDAAAISAADIDQLVDERQIRSAARPRPELLHLIIGPAAPVLYEQLNRLRVTTA